MTSFDPLLYIALAGGFLLGRLLRPSVDWLPRVTEASIVTLVFLLGATLGSFPIAGLLSVIPLSFLFTGILLGSTALTSIALSRRAGPPRPVAPKNDLAQPGWRWLFPVVLLVALVVGALVGRGVGLPPALLLPPNLYVLLFLVGLGLKLARSSARRVATALSAAGIGAFVAAVLVIALVRVPAPVAFATAGAFGWYTLAGPLVTRAAGPGFGLLAFLVNFLRELVTIALAPILGRRLGATGLAALGGATAMDTTLYSATRWGNDEGGSLPLVSGLVLTVTAGVLVPLVLSIG